MIFVVEDDPNIRELVTYTLQSTGFEACGFEDGASFFKSSQNGGIRIWCYWILCFRGRRYVDPGKTP